MLPKNFYKDVEKVGTLKHILYGDTDSLFIAVPGNVKEMNIDEKWELAEKTAEGINKLIVQYYTEYLLPRSNISPQHNEIYFKTELAMESAMFLDVKKNYAYKLICKEGVVIDPPKIKYTGIQVVKSDAAKTTQNLLKALIEGVVLNAEIPDSEKLNAVMKVVNDYKQQFKADINSLNFQNIGFPGKWAKRDLFINGMRIYNHIMGSDVFAPGSSAKLIYCLFRNAPMLKTLGIEQKDLKGICVPYEYDAELLKTRMYEYNIVLDENTQWKKLYTTTVDRVVNLVKRIKK